MSRKQVIFWLNGAAIFIIVLLLLVGKYDPPWPKVLEALLFILCLTLLISYAPMRSLLAALSRPQRVAITGITVVMVLAQLRDRHDESWPFIPWNMYRGRFDAPRYLEVVGITQDGRELEIPVGKVYQSQARTLLWRLQLLSTLMDNNDCEVKKLHRSEQFRTLLLNTVDRFQNQHPEIQMQSVCVNRCTLPRPGPGRKLAISRKKYLEYSLQ